jgi:hypothetical protein
MRGSSVHFKRISSALHAVSHASREVPPEYLLPADVSMGTHVVIDDHGQVQKALDHKMHLASRQAKATKDYSPLWEGVINLPEPSPDVTPAHQIQIVRQWCKDYEAMTGHKVLRADVHLDEGYIDADGKPHFNAHAHVMCDRTDEKGRVKKLTSTVLREVQNMTAEVTTLQRGIDSRKTGRKHIGHQHFRFDAEKNRLDVEKPKADLARLQKKSKEWSDADLSKIKDLQDKLDGEPARQAAALAAQKLQLDEQYRQDRAALKASGEAKQADYQALKRAHEGAIEALKESTKKVTALTQENQRLQEENQRLAERREAASRITLKTLQVDFGVDITPAEKLKGEALERWREAAEDRVAEQQFKEFQATAPEKRPVETTKRPTEAPKPPKAPSPSPIQEKSLVARFEASYRAFLDWIKGKNGVVVDLDTQQSDHFGPVVQLDDLHAVQSTGRGRYAVHELGKLDQVPALNDSRTEVHYRGGVGQVKGQSLGRGGRAD